MRSLKNSPTGGREVVQEDLTKDHLTADHLSTAHRSQEQQAIESGRVPKTTRLLKRQIQFVLHEEKGSISPLIITYFLITLIVVFIGINITHSYLERRHLILAMESSLQRATQQIDDWKYYTGDIQDSTVRYRQRGVTTFIPIDCNSARRVFAEEFVIQWSLTRVLNRPDLGGSEQERLRNSLWSSPIQSQNRSQSLKQSPASSQSQTPSPLGDRSYSGTPTSSLHENPTTHRLVTLSSIPRITGFHCDGKTVAADAELLIELPFGISFSGVNLMRFSRQQASVEVGLVFGG